MEDDEAYQRTRYLLLEQLRQLDQEFKKLAEPILRKLVELEACRPCPLLSELQWKTITSSDTI
jgi:hypothetical protein